jgi:uncharacterized surface protein with fasciclin (FAS1) repeats
MKLYFIIPLTLLLGCSSRQSQENIPAETAPPLGGQASVVDNTSKPDVVRIAANSNVHKTLVAALKAAEYVDALANAGPFTVFAPVDEAFDKLPAGTLDDLLKPENKGKLRDILEYHVYVGKITESQITDGMTLNQVNLKNITLNRTADGKITVNGSANVIGSVEASNGVVYVVDAVLLPSDK